MQLPKSYRLVSSRKWQYLKQSQDQGPILRGMRACSVCPGPWSTNTHEGCRSCASDSAQAHWPRRNPHRLLLTLVCCQRVWFSPTTLTSMLSMHMHACTPVYHCLIVCPRVWQHLLQTPKGMKSGRTGQSHRPFLPLSCYRHQHLYIVSSRTPSFSPSLSSRGPWATQPSNPHSHSPRALPAGSAGCPSPQVSSSHHDSALTLESAATSFNQWTSRRLWEVGRSVTWLWLWRTLYTFQNS